MSQKRHALYLHLVWATWDRYPFIQTQLERTIYRVISNQAIKLGCKVIAINGMPDHVHLIVKFPSTVTISEVVKKAKGVSSWYVNKNMHPNNSFKWQAGYGAFTISRWDLYKVINYVKNQKQHHSYGILTPELEEIII